MTTITTDYSRQFEVTGSGIDTFLDVRDTDTKRSISSWLHGNTAEELGEALLEAAGKKLYAFDDLPKVTTNGYYLRADNVSRLATTDPADVMDRIKGLLAIHGELVKREEAKKAEQEAAERAAKETAEAEKKAAEAEKKAAEAKAARRDELVREFNPTASWVATYYEVSSTARKAIDRIIELEDAAKA